MSTQRRVARKPHRCDCGQVIAPGHVYLVHTLFPNNDLGWELAHPIRLAECADCAGRYGRDYALHPIPEDQPWRYWLADERPQPPDPLDGAA